MIGNEVWVLVIIVIHHFNYTTYQRKGSSREDIYTLDLMQANVVDPKQITSKVFKWFESRGISQKTLDRSVVVTEGSEYMPQTGKSENTIQFNYIMGDRAHQC